MGRVLPSLTTRTGVISVADAVGTTKDQELQNALRRASAQREQARIEQSRDRMTPEGMLKFVGQTAQTVGQVTNAVGGVSSLIGKGLKALERKPTDPLSAAVRKAATSRATKQMVTPEARQMFEQTVAQTGVGQGAPVMADQFDGSPGIARTIQSLSQQGPQGRIAAEALKQQAEEDMQMRSLRDRSAAADVEVEEVTESLLPDEPSEGDATSERSQRFMEAATQAEEMVDSQAQPQQRIAEQETVDVLSDVTPMSDADVEQVRTEQVVQSLGATPRERQGNLLRLASSAFSSEDQARVLRASEMIAIEPTQVGDLFAPRQAFRRKLLKAFPSSAQQLSARKAAETAARSAARLESAADRLKQQREIETERQELKKDTEKRLREGQEADDKRADEALKLANERHRFAIEKDMRDRREWAYDREFKERKHKDIMENKDRALRLRDKISRRAGLRASRREGLDNARNVNRAIADEKKSAASLTKEIGGHIKQANSAVRQIESEKLRYKQKIAGYTRKQRRAYERRVLKPNKGKDPVLQDYDDRISDAKTDESNLKKKKQAASAIIKRLGELGRKARMPGSMMNYDQSLRFLDELREIQDGIDNNIFGEN